MLIASLPRAAGYHAMNRLATKQQKALLFVLQDGVCAMCHCAMDKWEAHHVIPWAKGGETTTQNLKLLCPSCHKLQHSSRAKVNKT
jgi:5-methylcytosine-specific restriction endonuclease McrA